MSASAPKQKIASTDPPRLSDGTVAALPGAIARPAYDRARLPVGIVHLGIGAFHRAHQAAYIDALLGRGFDPYGILGVSLRSPGVRHALGPQDGLYTLGVRDGERARYRLIGSVKAVRVAPEDPEAVLRHLIDPATRLATLTITEKGYCLAPSGRLDPSHPEIVHDLASPSAPCTAIGFLVEALKRIRATGTAPPTILPCDNLPSNGRTLRRALVDYAAFTDDRLAAWIESAVAVPCSMVDRIVPATTAADLAEAQAALGLEDRGAVFAEPFSQWVVENACADGMPALAEVGVEMVSDVAPYERMKLRMLNGSHSSLAYLGQLAGYEYVADAVADPALRRFIARMMADEIAPTLREFSAGRLAHYASQLLVRFANPAIRHRTWQISMDGSQKLPQRLLGTIADCLAEGRPVTRLALAIAAWMRFLGGRDDRGHAITVSDPRAAALMRWAAPDQSDAQIIGNIVEHSGLFPSALTESEGLRRTLIDAFTTLRSRGARETIKLAAYGGP